jgi:hypothetical protein
MATAATMLVRAQKLAPPPHPPDDRPKQMPALIVGVDVMHVKNYYGR